jgi:hypothetical protein
MPVSWAVSLILLLGSSSKAVRPFPSIPERFLADDLCTTMTVGSTGGGGNIFGRSTSLQLNSKGYPVISYYENIDISHGILKLATCNDDACSTPATIENVDSSGNGLYASLQLNVNGHPVISYYDSSKGDLKLATCNNVIC